MKKNMKQTLLAQYLAPGLVACCWLFGTAAQAVTITENFGSGANAFSIDFVEIGNPGNAGDAGIDFIGSPYSAGSVSYVYNLGKYEISRDMIDKANAAASLNISMRDLVSWGGNGVNRPASGISWKEAATFVNWLNTSTGNTAAYKFDGGGNLLLWSAGDAGYQASNPFRNSLARYWLPSLNEWYKGAYGSLDGSWYDYPTGSNSTPTSTTGGTTAGSLVIGRPVNNGPADVTNAGGLSAFGTMGQGGNVWELTESAYDGVNDSATETRMVRGGSWYNVVDNSSAANFGGIAVTTENPDYGFRIASGVPEPSALSLLAVGLGGWAMIRRRRGLTSSSKALR